MNSIGSIAASGMAAATARLQSSANKIAKTPSADDDLAGGIVEMIMARVSFAANAQVMKADTRMTKALFDITA